MTFFGLILIAYGIAILIGSLSLKEFSVEFTNVADKGTVAIPITASISGDVFVYVRFANVYQNVQWYVNSVSSSQLSGGIVTGDESSCDPWNYGPYPCGLIAASVYNDRLTFRIKRNGETSSSYLAVDESSATISSSVAQQTKNPIVPDHNASDPTRATSPFWLLRHFPPTICRPISADNSPGSEYSVTVDSNNLPECFNFNSEGASCSFTPACDPADAEEILNPAGWGVENSHFRNWMATASLPTFLKLRGKVSVPLNVGDIVYVDVRQVWAANGATKQIVITEANWQGGPSVFLPSCMIATGGCYVLAALVLFLMWRRKPRIQGDMGDYKFANASKLN
jgi:hypothetical protein